MREVVRLPTGIFTVSLFIHFLWEMLQSFAYPMDGQPLMRTVLNHLWATAGDGVLMVLIYGAIALWHRDARWIDRPRSQDAFFVVVLGGMLAVAIEWLALATGRWSYTSAMPMIPWLNVGLLPVAQLALLPFVVFWSSARLWPADGARGRSS
jgi:hypothetical protein